MRLVGDDSSDGIPFEIRERWQEGYDLALDTLTDLFKDYKDGGKPLTYGMVLLILDVARETGAKWFNVKPITQH